MEMAVVLLSSVVAIAAAVIALVVSARLLRQRKGPLPVSRIASTIGFRWLVLGIGAMVVYALLNLSIVLPLLIALGGLVAVAIGLRRRDDDV